MASEPQPSPRELRRIFDEYDADSNGLIDHTEMVRRLLLLCLSDAETTHVDGLHGTSTAAWLGSSPNPHACTHTPISCPSFP